MTHKVISQCYLNGILREVGDLVSPTPEDAERLVWAQCLVAVPEPAPVQTSAFEPKPEPVEPPAADEDERPRKRKKRR